MDRRFTPPKRVITSPTWGLPPPCKQALRFDEISPRSLSSRSDLSRRNIFHLARPDLRDITNLAEFLARSLYLAKMPFISARSRRDLREITNLAEFLARSRLSRRNLFHIGEISSVSQKYLTHPRPATKAAYGRDLYGLSEGSFILWWENAS